MEKLSEILQERGYVYQYSSGTLEEITDGPKRTLYLGVDPTADSFHIGHLQALLVMRRFLEDGHKVILLIGGGTGMIGDPSGKSEERNLLDFDVVAQNGNALQKQAERIFGGKSILLRNNADWLMPLKLVDFLRDIGKHFTVNAMIKREMVRERLEKESSISYTEFAYSVLQAYDFLHLHETEGCDLQLGASDQWGNIASGVELIRKKKGAVAYGFTSPLLINKSTGKKFGKSEQGAVWLDAAKTSPFQMYQFLLGSEDEAVEEYLLKLTMLHRAEIDAAMEMHRRNPGARHAQRLLANSVTTLVHGAREAQNAEKISAVLFGDGAIADLGRADIDTLAQSAPSCIVAVGADIVEVLISASLASSKREARQLIADKAVTLNGETVSEANRNIVEEDFIGGIALLRRGKRNVCVLRLA